MDNKFFHQVRIPRWVLNADSPEKRNLIFRWTERICRDIGYEWKPVAVSFPQRNQTRIFISGREKNTQLAAQLVRKAIIEICNDKFDALEALDFMEEQVQLAHREEEKTARDAVKNACRVDFKIAVENMSSKQLKSFDNLQDVFFRMGVDVSDVENKPTFIQLRCSNPDILKCAKLTAEWAAKEIFATSKISPNSIEQKVRRKSIELMGREKGHELTEILFN